MNPILPLKSLPLSGNSVDINTGNGWWFCTTAGTFAVEHAALIINAVNSHDDLVAALEMANKVIAELISPDAILQTTVMHTWAHLIETSTVITAALQKAKEQQ